MRSLVPTTLSFFAEAPTTITASATVPASPAAVFDALADAAGWTAWFPLLYRSAWQGPGGGLGAEREVALRVFGRYRERMIAWEPGARFAFTMTATTSPFVQQMAEDYRLSPAGAGTRIDWIMAAIPTVLGRAATPVLRQAGTRLFRNAGRRLGEQLRRHA